MSKKELQAGLKAALDILKAAELQNGVKEWSPLPGPQSEAFNSPADELLYGGAAGGGKTDLLLGLAYKEHKRALILRREYPRLNAIVERSREIYAKNGEYNETKGIWKFKHYKRVRFASVQHEKDKRGFQGQAQDFYGFDEITEFTESQYRFLTAWNRSAHPNQRCRIVCTCNPPTSAEGDWILRHWGAWLDPSRPNPAKPGELRFYTTIDGKDVEFMTDEPVEVKGKLVKPRSRTFIPAKVQDNPYLINSGYIETLQALPEPLRSKLMFGDFSAGREDDAYQVIPTEWVRMAQERWKERPDAPQTAIGVDVARGGADKTVIAVRYGNWLDELKTYPGTSTPDGPAAAALVMAQRRDKSIINVDVIGVGTSVYDHLKGLTDGVMPINGAERSTAKDKTGELRFVNLRAQYYWQLREALDPTSGEDIALPPDTELLSDLCAPTWKLTIRGIQIEAKDDLIKRIGRSPDKGDAVVYAFAIKNMSARGLFDWIKGLAGGNK